MKIFVGNLSYSATENDLIDAFSPFGKILSTKIIKRELDGELKGCFAFVEMESKEEGENAIRELNGTSLKNRTINVSVARPKEDRGYPNRGEFRKSFGNSSNYGNKGKRRY